MLELLRELIIWVKSWFVNEQPALRPQNRQPLPQLPPPIINQRQAGNISNPNMPKKKFEIQIKERKSFQVLEIRQAPPRNRSASGRSFIGVMSRPRHCPRCLTPNTHNSIKRRDNKWWCDECGFDW